MSRLRQFYRLFVPYRGVAAAAFGAMLAVNVLDLALPWALKLLVDNVVPGRNVRLLALLCAGLVVVFLLKFAAGFLREYLFAFLGESVVRDLRNRLYWHIQRLSVEYRENTPSGTVISGLIGDVDSIKGFLFGGMIDFLFSLLTIVLVMAVCLALNWRLTLVAAAFIPFYAVAYLRHFPALRRRHGQVRGKFAELTARVAEVLAGMRVVAGYAREEYEAGVFAAKQQEIMSVAMKSHRAALLLMLGADLFSSLGLAAVVWVGGSMALAGELSAGTLVAFYSYLAMLLVPVIRVAVIGSRYQEAAAASDRINAVLERRPQITDPVRPFVMEDVRGGIEYRGVFFAYPGGAEVLRGIDLSIPAGTTVAIVGKSGEGKTTLVNLLLRFYHPSSGTVLVDGRDIACVELKSLRARMSMVLQDDHLFSGTVGENIRYGRFDASGEEVVAASRAANAHEFIMRLPGGYDAQIGEGGVKLSFGQRQRISIARAIVRNPAILILDEATSGVDSGTERGIVEEAYRHAMAGRTTLIIAHRLGVIRDADRIVVIDGGRVAESGRHEELIARRGLYWKMWNEQRDGAVTGGL